MEISIIKSEKHKSIKWSGGTSTELFISPENADYKKRDFDFRLSTATVEVEKSDFTPLLGFSRKLMILDGSIKIQHENHYSKQLNKFESDEFEGDWKTSSIGKCIDFNLMYNSQTNGEINSIVIELNNNFNLNISDKSNWLFIYAFSGKVKININSNIQNLNKGDLLIIKSPNLNKVQIISIEKSELIITNLFK